MYVSTCMAHDMLRYRVVCEGVCGRDYIQTIRLSKDQTWSTWAQTMQIFVQKEKQRKVEFHFCPLELGHQSSLIPCVTYQSWVFRQDQKEQYWLLDSQACSPVSPDHTCHCLIINNQQAITLGLSLRITLTTIREGRQLYSFTCATPDVTSSSGVDSLIYLFSTVLFSSYFELFLQIV